MIYTVTLNPSIDYVITLENLTLGQVNRLNSDQKLPGGKGINVSRILKRLNIDSTALGFLGGFTGDFIHDELSKEDITCKFTKTTSDTRINVKIKSQNETEINGQGPLISEEQIQSFLTTFNTLIHKNDIVVLAGSMPQGLSQNFYNQLIDIIHEKEADFIIDTTGNALIEALPKKPLLVKPNHHELAEIYHTTFNSTEDILPYGQRLLADGAKYAIISMAGDGALFFTSDHIYFANPIKGTVQNSVGAGDSMIAGFTGSFATDHDELAAFKMGVACGTATAFSKDLADKQTIDHYLSKVTIEKLK